MKLEVNELKSDRDVIWKNLDKEIEGGICVKIEFFGHSLRNWSLKVSHLLGDGRRK